MSFLPLKALRHWLGIVVMVMPISEASMAASPPLEGVWAGDRLRLTATATGANLELECADGAIQGPLRPDSDGKFTAIGTFAARGGGPQRADAAPSPAARYAGVVTNDVLTLSIWPLGAAEPQVYRLRKGAQIKMIRCY